CLTMWRPTAPKRPLSFAFRRWTKCPIRSAWNRTWWSSSTRADPAHGTGIREGGPAGPPFSHASGASNMPNAAVTAVLHPGLSSLLNRAGTQFGRHGVMTRAEWGFEVLQARET